MSRRWPAWAHARFVSCGSNGSCAVQCSGFDRSVLCRCVFGNLDYGTSHPGTSRPAIAHRLASLRVHEHPRLALAGAPRQPPGTGVIDWRSRTTVASLFRMSESSLAQREFWYRPVQLGLSRASRFTGHDRTCKGDTGLRYAAFLRPFEHAGTCTAASLVCRWCMPLAVKPARNRKLEPGFAPVSMQIRAISTGGTPPYPKRNLRFFNSTIYLLMSSCTIGMGWIRKCAEGDRVSAFHRAQSTLLLRIVHRWLRSTNELRLPDSFIGASVQ